MKLRPALLALALVAATPPWASSVASDASTAAIAGELCFGQVPTIVGAQGEFAQGTEGPDVVITNGAYAADTLGGDDLLCVGKVVEAGDEYGFITGAGSDRIDATQAGGGLFYLGPGADEFIGSDDGPDTVYANDASKGDTDADVVTTGEATDEVTSSGADVVNLGPAIDVLHLEGDVSGGAYTGGPGADALEVFLRRGPEEPHSWTLNSRTTQLLRDGVSVAGFDGFTYFAAAAPGSVTFIGSDTREIFNMSNWSARHSQIDVRMGGGDDSVTFFGGAPGGRFDGGAGTDQFWYYREDAPFHRHTSILFDLASGLLRDTWDSGATTRRAFHFENTRVFSGGGNEGPVTIKGTSGPNQLRATQPTGTAAAIHGRGGDDSLFGGYGNDVLIGGPGQDVATGRSGTDRCDAETRINCES